MYTKELYTIKFDIRNDSLNSKRVLKKVLMMLGRSQRGAGKIGVKKNGTFIRRVKGTSLTERHIIFEGCFCWDLEWSTFDLDPYLLAMKIEELNNGSYAIIMRETHNDVSVRTYGDVKTVEVAKPRDECRRWYSVKPLKLMITMKREEWRKVGYYNEYMKVRSTQVLKLLFHSLYDSLTSYFRYPDCVCEKADQGSLTISFTASEPTTFTTESYHHLRHLFKQCQAILPEAVLEIKMAGECDRQTLIGLSGYSYMSFTSGSQLNTPVYGYFEKEMPSY